jgi:DNA (cytosine-5)-methyltransferase 1
MPNGDIVTPDLRDAERLQGFASNWTEPAERAARAGFRWKLVGNAVSVPVARWVGQRLASPGVFRPPAAATPVTVGKAWPTNAWNVGNGRLTAPLSEWPKRYKRPSLEAFLRHPTRALSIRATAGFLGRARRSTLHFPAGFLEALEAHLRCSQVATAQDPL